MLVSIIIPVIRPDKAKRCIEAIAKNAGVPHIAEVPPAELAQTNCYEIVTEEDKKRIGVTKMVKRLTEKSRGDMVCFIGDDCIPQPDFLKNALRAMAAIPDGWGMVSFNDNPNTTRSAAHWLCSKKLLPLIGGEFFHTGYQHCFCDDELLMKCQALNRYIYAFDAYIYHEHSAVHKDVQPDESFKDVHSEEKYGADHKLFLARMRNNWETPEPVAPQDPSKIVKPLKVLIGIPSGETFQADFAISLVNLVTHSITRGIQIAIVNQKGSLVEINRNEIVATALELDADKILFLDTDMVFPAATLQRLLSHKKDIVCSDAVRRMTPITSVLTGMDGNPLTHPPGADKSSPLVEVKGGTSAVQLVDVGVFRRIQEPYFLVTFNDKNKSFLGEDYYFSNKARQAGFKIWCDPYLSQFVGHTGAKTYYMKDREKETTLKN